MVAQHPPFLVAVRERRDTRRLKFLRGFVELGQRFGQLGDAGFLEQVLVVNEAVAFQSHRLSVDFAVLGHRFFRNRNKVFYPGLVGEIFEMFHPRVHFLEAAVVENVRRIAAGKLRLKRRAVIRASAYGLDVQLHAGMRFFVFGFDFVQRFRDFNFKLKNFNRFRSAFGRIAAIRGFTGIAASAACEHGGHREYGNECECRKLFHGETSLYGLASFSMTSSSL